MDEWAANAHAQLIRKAAEEDTFEPDGINVRRHYDEIQAAKAEIAAEKAYAEALADEQAAEAARALADAEAKKEAAARAKAEKEEARKAKAEKPVTKVTEETE